jgi:S-DNA-T family DNA segregation ATPase FtsK/SpoIIIE
MLGTALTILVAGAVCGSADILRGSEMTEDEIKERWNKLMYATGMKTKGDEAVTYYVSKVIKRIYGNDIIVAIPIGMTYSTLETIEEEIKICFKCHEVSMHSKEGSASAYMRLVSKPIAQDYPFQPVKVRPWELYMGTTKYYKDIIVDMTTYPHVLIAGTTGSGKSLYAVQGLINLISNHTADVLNVYISEVSAKDDYKAFRDCPHVKQYARNLEDTTKMLKHLLDEMNGRNDLFNQYDGIDNIMQYNKAFPHKALPYVYLLSDEYHLYMEDDSDTDEVDYYKKQCQSCLKELAKLCRNTGIYIIASLQRPDKESMPPIFKTNMNVIVAFKQRNGASALTILDSYKPMALKQREAIVDFGGDQFNIYSLYINNYMIKRYLTMVNGIEEKHKYIDLTPYIYIDEEARKHSKNGKKKGKKSKVEKIPELESAPTTDNVTNLEDVIKDVKGKGGKGKDKGVVRK